jgi:hypothetical protein
MAYLVNEIQNKVRPELRRRIPIETISLITDTEFFDIINRVQRDINVNCDINWERYHEECTVAETNYELAGKILKINYFSYEAADWKDQRFTYIDDVIVLETAPDDTFQMDIRYLRDTGDLSSVTDEIDLPDQIMSDFIDLVRTLALVRFSDKPQEIYDGELLQKTTKIRMMFTRRGTLPDKGVFKYSPISTKSGHTYDITDQWVSSDSVVYDGSEYIFVE